MKVAKLTDFDLLSLVYLLKSDISLKEALVLIQSKDNQKTIDQIILELNKGIKIETIIEKYIKKNTYIQLKPFLKILPFKDALNLALEFLNNYNDFKKQFKKDLLYPLSIAFISAIALILFNHFGISKMLLLLDNFNLSTTTILKISEMINLFIKIITIVIITFSLFILLNINKKNIKYLYRIIIKIFKRPLIQLYYTYEFIYHFNLCLDNGLSTKDTIDILRRFKHSPIISLLAFQFDDVLSKGENLEKAIQNPLLDEKLLNYIRLSHYSGKTSKLLNIYLNQNKSELKRRIKLYTKLLQLFVYGLVAVVIILLYQILFLPMQAFIHL